MSDDSIEPGSPSSAAAHHLAQQIRAERQRSASLVAESLSRGTVLDRYVILAPLGRGGMGIVYLAHDPELDRKVALKLLPPHEAGAANGAQARLIREAQALARLAHPNVVAVHDVGLHGDSVWIAMEFVAGQTLRVWGAGQRRRWPEVLRVLIEVARGVAAVHAAGLVHRDLKPDNVMIDELGRVRVMDFGLAHHDAPPGSLTSMLASPGDRETAVMSVQRLTRSGLVVGTPHYMAPEQWDGDDVEAAADQFGWCVMAWELLYGELPFACGSLDELLRDVRAGKLRVPPKRAKVPGWLRRVVTRGLMARPQQRWPAMTTLLAQIERGRVRARARVAIFGFGAAAVMTAAILGRAVYVERRQIAECVAAGASIFEVWNDDVKSTIRAAFAASGTSYGQIAADKVVPWLDRRIEVWRAARTETCLDATVRGTWDATMLERSLWCLDERRMEVELAVQEFMRGDAGQAQTAVETVTDLPQIGPCRDEDHLRRSPVPPWDHREEVRALQAGFARTFLLSLQGKYELALASARADLSGAVSIGWPPLVAAAKHKVGNLLFHTGRLSESEHTLEDAFFSAVAVGSIEQAIQASVDLTSVVGYHLVRPLDGLRWGRQGEALVAMLGERDSLVGTDLPFTIAHVHMALGNDAEAGRLYEQTLARWEEALGPEHPDVAAVLNNLALVRRRTGDPAVARELHERALDMHIKVLGPEHQEVAKDLNNLANLHHDAKNFAEARRLYARALAIEENASGGDHPNVARQLGNLASAIRYQGDVAATIPLYRRSLAILERAYGSTHHDVAAIAFQLALSYQTLGEHAEATRYYRQALEVSERQDPPIRFEIAEVLRSLATVALLDDRPSDALALVERLLVVLKQDGQPPAAVAVARFMQAQALWSGGSQRGRAVALARDAREVLRAAGEPAREDLAALEAWLASR